MLQAIAIAGLFLAASSIQAQAEVNAAGVSSADDKIVESLKQERQRGTNNGVVVIEAGVYIGKTWCDRPQVTFGRMIDGRMQGRTTYEEGFFTRESIGMKVAPAGEYQVLRVACQYTANRRITLDGPHANFRVLPYEVVNVGTLRLDYESAGFLSRSGTVRRSVQPLFPKVLERMKERLPKTAARTLNRPMTVTAPAGKVEDNSLFGL